MLNISSKKTVDNYTLFNPSPVRCVYRVRMYGTNESHVILAQWTPLVLQKPEWQKFLKKIGHAHTGASTAGQSLKFNNYHAGRGVNNKSPPFHHFFFTGSWILSVHLFRFPPCE